MAIAPTTLIPPGAGGPVLLDFCECVCGILSAVPYVSQRGATAGPAYDAPSDPTRVPGEDPYTVAQARLAAQPYPAFEPSQYITPAGIPGPVTLASVRTSWQLNGPTSSTMSISTDTAPHPDEAGYPQASASLLQSQYKLRIGFPAPWQGDSALKISWRERTVHYSLLYVYNGGGVQSEEASFSYQDFSETLTPTPGAMYVETSVHVPTPGLGDEVSVTGPSAIGTFFVRQMQSESDGGQTQCGILVTAVAVAAQKCGFLPYVRPHASTTSGEGAQPQDIYATETASTAQGFTTQYSGAQTFQPSDQIVATTSGVGPANTFLGNVPPSAISQYDGSGFSSPSTVGATEVTPTVLQWSPAVAAGLVMTLSDPIPTSALTGYVDGQLGAAPSPMLGDLSGVLAMSYLPADELSYAVKQATQQGYLDIAIDSGIQSHAPIQNAPVLALLKGAEVDITVDLLTTDLDTGEQTDSQLTFSFAINSTAVGIQIFSLTQAQVAVPAPATNQMITWSNPQVTTATLDRWCAQPQVQVVDAAAT